MNNPNAQNIQGQAYTADDQNEDRFVHRLHIDKSLERLEEDG